MGQKYVTASASIQPGPLMITSVIVTPNAGQLSATCTIYNATAATANTEIMKFVCGTAPQTITWGDSRGVEVQNMYVALTCATATVVWE